MHLVVYDISNNKRRTKLHKSLLNYGIPVQFSVFEISELYLEDVKKTCTELLKKDDSVRIYHLCKRCTQAVLLYGKNTPVLDEKATPCIIEVPDAPVSYGKRRAKVHSKLTRTR